MWSIIDSIGSNIKLATYCFPDSEFRLVTHQINKNLIKCSTTRIINKEPKLYGGAVIITHTICLVYTNQNGRWERNPFAFSYIWTERSMNFVMEKKNVTKRHDRLLILICSLLWNRVLIWSLHWHGGPFPIPSRAGFSEILLDKFFSNIRILAFDKVFQALPVRKIFSVTVSCDNVETPTVLEIAVPANL